MSPSLWCRRWTKEQVMINPERKAYKDQCGNYHGRPLASFCGCDKLHWPKQLRRTGYLAHTFRLQPIMGGKPQREAERMHDSGLCATYLLQFKQPWIPGQGWSHPSFQAFPLNQNNLLHMFLEVSFNLDTSHRCLLQRGKDWGAMLNQRPESWEQAHHCYHFPELSEIPALTLSYAWLLTKEFEEKLKY